MQDTQFELGGRKYRSRLIVGTGKYRDFAETKAAVEESGAEIVTVAVRRVNITDRGKENLLHDSSTRSVTRFCRIPPDALPPRRRFARAALRARWESATW